MPVLKVHFETSLRRTGAEHRDVHEFVDAPGKKDERHDIKKIFEFGEMIRDDDLALLRKAGVAEKDVGHSLKVAQKALDIARRTGAQSEEGFALSSLGIVHLKQGDLARAVELGVQALAVFIAIGDAAGAADAAGHLGQAYAAAGDLAQALHYREMDLAYLSEIGHPEAGPLSLAVAELRRRLNPASAPPAAPI